ncbi:MAG TPA: hypothetical protein VFK13_05745 [Gemmatimonadaceae bacterium]|nr:hypothetical protein [Gemmatimonadaceae bacterium]
MRATHALLLAALLAGCAHDAPPRTADGSTSAGSTPDGRASVASVAEGSAFLRGASGHATIAYQPNVHMMERDAGMAALHAVNRNGSTLLFDASVPQIAALHTGDILVIKGLLARRVVAVKRVGAEIGVLTEPASLGEVVRDGHITLHLPVHFTPVPAVEAQRPARTPWDALLALAVPDALAQSPGGERLKRGEEDGKTDAYKKLAMGAVNGVFKGWETTFTAVPGNNRVDLSITLTKDVGGFVAKITGDGYLADFALDAGIDVERGIVDQVEMASKRINGVMNFNWEVSKDTPGAFSGNDRIKLPAALSAPLGEFVGGLPLFLEVSSAVIIEPAISGGKEYSHGAFRITYDGAQGFSVKKGNIDDDGNITGDIQFIESRNISALAPLGMVVAFAAPRIELTLGTSKLFEMSEAKEAAEKVEEIADDLIEAAYGEEALEKWKDSPMGSVSIRDAIADAVESDAAGYIELVTSTGMSNTGMSAIAPCTRTDIHMTVTVGASAQALGQQLGEAKKVVFKRDLARVDPPGAHLCEQVGEQAGG